jgi:hypothetical protein
MPRGEFLARLYGIGLDTSARAPETGSNHIYNVLPPYN